MGDYDFLGGFDFGDLGNGVAGAGANMPDLGGGQFNIPNLDLPNFTVPPMDAGVMGGINIPNMPYNFPGAFEPGDPTGTAGGVRIPGVNPPMLPPGQGVMAPGQPTPGQGGFDLSQILGQAQGPLKTLTGLGGLGVSALGVKSSLDAARNAREQAAIQRGFQQNQQDLQKQQQQSVAPLQQFGTNQLQRSAAGQVDPAIQAYIDQWAQGQKVKMAQQFAKMGLTNSPMYQSALGQIDQQALTMRSSVIGQDKQQAIAALQAAMGGTVGAMGGANAGAMVANQEQNQLDNLIKSSHAALAQLNAMAS